VLIRVAALTHDVMNHAWGTGSFGIPGDQNTDRRQKTEVPELACGEWGARAPGRARAGGGTPPERFMRASSVFAFRMLRGTTGVLSRVPDGAPNQRLDARAADVYERRWRSRPQRTRASLTTRELRNAATEDRRQKIYGSTNLRIYGFTDYGIKRVHSNRDVGTEDGGRKTGTEDRETGDRRPEDRRQKAAVRRIQPFPY
jgi:hypothetical protein